MKQVESLLGKIVPGRVQQAIHRAPDIHAAWRLRAHVGERVTLADRPEDDPDADRVFRLSGVDVRSGTADLSQRPGYVRFEPARSIILTPPQTE